MIKLRRITPSILTLVLTSALALMPLLMPTTAFAQMDEIIVTGTRISGDSDTPGIFLEKRGDFLLLEVEIESDAREISERLTEISQTVEAFIKAAAATTDIKLSIVDENDFVRQLSLQNYREGIMFGGRPDTSVATLKVKTEIPDTVVDSYKLAKMLGNFVDTVPEKGRITITASDEVLVSVVDPYQYRPQVQALLVDEVRSLTSGLGPDYRAVITGLDKELQWVRSGDLNLAFYLSYRYDIIPASLTTYNVVIED